MKTINQCEPSRLRHILIMTLPFVMAVLSAGCRTDSGDESDGGDAGSDTGDDIDTGADAGDDTGTDDGGNTLPPLETDLSPDDVCPVVCETYEACGAGYLEGECLQTCDTEYLALQVEGQQCRVANVLLHDCLGSLSCDDLAAFYARTSEDYPCADMEAQAMTYCFHDIAPGAQRDSTDLCAFSGDCRDERLFIRFLTCVQQHLLVYEIGVIDSEECGDTVRAEWSCALDLGCEDFALWEDKEGSYPCETEHEAIIETCPSLHYL